MPGSRRLSGDSADNPGRGFLGQARKCPRRACKFLKSRWQYLHASIPVSFRTTNALIRETPSPSEKREDRDSLPFTRGQHRPRILGAKDSGDEDPSSPPRKRARRVSLRFHRGLPRLRHPARRRFGQRSTPTLRAIFRFPRSTVLSSSEFTPFHYRFDLVGPAVYIYSQGILESQGQNRRRKLA